MILCIESCIYQRNGSCNLRRAASSGGTASQSGCAYYIESKKQYGGK